MTNNIPLHILEEWEMGDKIGKGGLSEGVYKAEKKDGKINNFNLPNGECVIKIIKVLNDKYNLYKKECSIIDKLIEIYDKLEGVIKYYGYAKYIDENYIEYIYIYMEYLEKYESIGILLKEKYYNFNEDQVYFIGYKLSLIIGILHSNNIIHRDIKCDNILLNLSTGDIKLIDFGISKHCESIKKPGNHTFSGTLTHMAPETLSSFGKNIRVNKSDIWSIGCTILELLGVDLNINISREEIVQKLSLKNIDLKLIIQHCLVNEPTSRELILDYKFLFLKWPKENPLSLFDKPITSNSMPSSGTKLFLQSFNESNISGSISLITKYNLSQFVQPITRNSIPSLTKLYTSYFYQPIILNSIPSSVTQLYISSFEPLITLKSIPSSVAQHDQQSFNPPISIPSSGIKLCIFSYNQPIILNSIPSSVTKLELSSFNQPITPNSIPSSVTSLYLHSFNQPITPNSIPSSVTELELSSFNQPITPNLIPSVKYLNLQSFNHYMEEDSIPSSVEELILNDFDLNNNGDFLPDSILKFECNFKFQSSLKKNNNIPKKTSKLILRNYNLPITKDSIPGSVVSLQLGFNYKDFYSFKNLPKSIITLSFGVNSEENYNYESIKDEIPSHITSINIY